MGLRLGLEKSVYLLRNIISLQSALPIIYRLIIETYGGRL